MTNEPFKVMSMLEWRDGQPCCANLKCLAVLHVGSHVVQGQKSHLFYCSGDCFRAREYRRKSRTVVGFEETEEL